MGKFKIPEPISTKNLTIKPKHILPPNYFSVPDDSAIKHDHKLLRSISETPNVPTFYPEHKSSPNNTVTNKSIEPINDRKRKLPQHNNITSIDPMNNLKRRVPPNYNTASSSTSSNNINYNVLLAHFNNPIENDNTLVLCEYSEIFNEKKKEHNVIIGKQCSTQRYHRPSRCLTLNHAKYGDNRKSCTNSNCTIKHLHHNLDCYELERSSIEYELKNLYKTNNIIAIQLLQERLHQVIIKNQQPNFKSKYNHKDDDNHTENKIDLPNHNNNSHNNHRIKPEIREKELNQKEYNKSIYTNTNQITNNNLRNETNEEPVRNQNEFQNLAVNNQRFRNNELENRRNNTIENYNRISMQENKRPQRSIDLRDNYHSYHLEFHRNNQSNLAQNTNEIIKNTKKANNNGTNERSNDELTNNAEYTSKLTNNFCTYNNDTINQKYKCNPFSSYRAH